MRARLRGTAAAAAMPLVAVLFALPGTNAAASSAPYPPARPGVQPPGPVRHESIPTYDVVLTLRTDGILQVRETITYDFARGGEHGIVRRVPFRHADRLYDVRNVSTSSSTGAPARARTLKLLHDVQITVGDRHREVRGRQAYVIEYEMAWVFTPFADHDELVWDALGTAWDVPIGNAAVRVEAPVPLRNASCRAGSADETTRCVRDRDGPYAVDFTQSALRPHEGMTVRVRLPKGAISVPPPRYAPPHWTGTWPGTAVLALAVGAVVVAARRPVPHRRAGRAVAAAGALLVAADVGDDVAIRGPWAFSLGDRSLAGLALMIVGMAAVRAHRPGLLRGEGPARPTARSGTAEHAASTLREDYS
ncbi:DUF2207 domain-containing protein [Actinomadura graeca]|uniref:DUF2207 domain-containing protein n=1 Tax=Actinomadura graeca TaxID=2750812 RepID=A0ABX8QUX0_9ACTN|nr:DUF2207 domain-containing protein [Actinomadura graeca]QXJ21774.1 DUF2207 domain-containing protein [Actinomadura graeca]